MATAVQSSILQRTTLKRTFGFWKTVSRSHPFDRSLTIFVTIGYRTNSPNPSLNMIPESLKGSGSNTATEFSLPTQTQRLGRSNNSSPVELAVPLYSKTDDPSPKDLDPTVRTLETPNRQRAYLTSSRPRSENIHDYLRFKSFRHPHPGLTPVQLNPHKEGITNLAGVCRLTRRLNRTFLREVYYCGHKSHDLLPAPRPNTTKQCVNCSNRLPGEGITP